MININSKQTCVYCRMFIVGEEATLNVPELEPGRWYFDRFGLDIIPSQLQNALVHTKCLQLYQQASRQCMHKQCGTNCVPHQMPPVTLQRQSASLSGLLPLNNHNAEVPNTKTVIPDEQLQLQAYLLPTNLFPNQDGQQSYSDAVLWDTSSYVQYSHTVGSEEENDLRQFDFSVKYLFAKSKVASMLKRTTALAKFECHRYDVRLSLVTPFYYPNLGSRTQPGPSILKKPSSQKGQKRRVTFGTVQLGWGSNVSTHDLVHQIIFYETDLYHQKAIDTYKPSMQRYFGLVNLPLHASESQVDFCNSIDHAILAKNFECDEGEEESFLPYDQMAECDGWTYRDWEKMRATPLVLNVIPSDCIEEYLQARDETYKEDRTRLFEYWSRTPPGCEEERLYRLRIKQRPFNLAYKNIFLQLINPDTGDIYLVERIKRHCFHIGKSRPPFDLTERGKKKLRVMLEERYKESEGPYWTADSLFTMRTETIPKRLAELQTKETEATFKKRERSFGPADEEATLLPPNKKMCE